MKYRFALLAVMAVSAAPLAAQGGGAGGQGGGMMAGGQAGGRGGRGNINNAAYDQLNTWFAFTAEQKPKVEAAVKERDAVTGPMNIYRQSLQAAQAAGGGRGFPALPADSQKKVDDASTKFRDALKAALTGPQVATFDSLVAASARGGQGRGGQRGGGGGF